MSETSSGGDTQDEELLADLFDTLLQEILEGRTPDLDALHQDRPELRARIQKTWSLACSVAGRREPSRPVFGGYEILRELGHGGMGTVYLARHQTLQREVAIKVLPQSLAMSPRAKQRFVEEARSLAQLRHENVVHIHRIVDHTEMLAFEMEFIDGPSLQKLMVALRKQTRPFALQNLAEAVGVAPERLGARNGTEWFVRLGIRIARALGEVHRLGLVHRDVKPANILLRRDGTPVLADFGLALQADLDDKPGRFAGTPVYAAPERLRGDAHDADARTDVYSLGATLYEALTLCPPFRGSTTQDVLRHIEAGRARPVRQIAPHVSQDLATIVTKAMELDAKHRYTTADELADDLERLLDLQPILARPAGPVRRCAKFVRRHRQAFVAAAAGAMLVALIAWPLAALAAGRDADRRAADAARYAARSKLLCQETLPSWWRTDQRDTCEVRQTGDSSLRRQALAAALDHYRDAIAATPEDELLQGEAAAVRAAKALIDEPGAATVVEARAGAPTLLTKLANGKGAWSRSPEFERQVTAASPSERFAAGLFAFLVGDREANRLLWQDLPASLQTDPLVDACTALRLTIEGQAGFAYPRIFQAVRTFPDATALVVAMADGAMQAGDLAQARRWLETIPVSDDAVLDARRQLVAADLLAADGQPKGAMRGYRELSRTDPTDPRPVLRMAELLLRNNDLDKARRLWQAALRRWPNLAPAHRHLARQALQRHDLPDYLHEVRAAMAPDADPTLLEDLLRLGGIGTAEHQADGRQRQPRLAADALPLAAWLDREQIAAVGRAIDVLPVLDGLDRLASALDARPIGAAMILVGLCGLRFPDVTARLPRPLQGALLAIPVLLGQPTDALAAMLLPYQTMLGSSVHSITDRQLFTVELEDPDLYYGLQMLAVDDLDGDTLPELCISAPRIGGAVGNGMVELRSSYDGSLLRTWRDDGGDAIFARAIAVLGDVDGDLCSEVLIGKPRGSMLSPVAPAIELRSGRDGGRLWQIEDPRTSFGAALAAIGDVDGDGRRDFVVGVSPMQLDQPGHALLCSGRDGRRILECQAPHTGVWFGGAVAGAGDLNGDGVDDVLVGGNYGRAPGLVCAFDGRTGQLLLQISDENPSLAFGQTLCALGDIDRDGIADFAISAAGPAGIVGIAGLVRVISGRSGNSLFELRGDRDGDGFGAQLCWLPDWRGDGRPALAIAARRGGPIGNGYVRVFDLTTALPMQSFAGSRGLATFGQSLVDLGDRDGDGLPELGIMVRTLRGSFTMWAMGFADLPANAAGTRRQR